MAFHQSLQASLQIPTTLVLEQQHRQQKLYEGAVGHLGEAKDQLY